MTAGRTPSALTIAGSDSGGGAGIQADLKTFSARGVYGASAITAITAQNTRGVTAIEMIRPEIVRAQIDAVLSDIDIHAIKIGMLGSAELTRAVAEAIAGFTGPVIIDPVMIAKSGDRLLDEDAVDALRTELLPRATLLTPNLPEAASLADDTRPQSPTVIQEQGRTLLAAGAAAVLIKGGHGDEPLVSDYLFSAEESRVLTASRIATSNTHGTGCSFSSAIAAEMAKQKDIVAAVQIAHKWLNRAINGADRLFVGHGHGPVHHFVDVWNDGDA